MSASPGDRPGIPLGSEPVVSFHALTAGTAEPGPVQPAGEEPPALEEEPALWPTLRSGFVA